MKRPDRFSRKSCVQSLMSARELRLSQVTAKPVRSGLVESARVWISSFVPRESTRHPGNKRRGGCGGVV